MQPLSFLSPSRLFGVTGLLTATACSLTSGETTTYVKASVCKALVFPDGGGTVEATIHYEIAASYANLPKEAAHCTVTIDGVAHGNPTPFGRSSVCEANGLPGGGRAFVSIGDNRATATVEQAFNGTSLRQGTVPCTLSDGRYVCAGTVALQAKPFYTLSLSVGHKRMVTKGGDFDGEEEGKDFFGCFETSDPAEATPQKRFTSGPSQRDGEWLCHFQDAAGASFEISSRDLAAATLSDKSTGASSNLTCVTSKTSSSEH